MTKDTQRTSARILVVDDEPDLRTLYELTLLRAGHQVESASGRSPRQPGPASSLIC